MRSGECGRFGKSDIGICSRAWIEIKKHGFCTKSDEEELFAGQLGGKDTDYL